MCPIFAGKKSKRKTNCIGVSESPKKRPKVKSPRPVRSTRKKMVTFAENLVTVGHRRDITPPLFDDDIESTEEDGEESDDEAQDPTYFRGMEEMSQKQLKQLAQQKKMEEIFGTVVPTNPTHARVLARINEIGGDQEKFDEVMATNGYNEFMQKLFEDKPGQFKIHT